MGTSVAILVLGYLPGWATIRWLEARGHLAPAFARLAPFPDILLSASLSAWGAFALAEMGVFSLGRLATALAAFTAVLGLTARPAPWRLPRPTAATAGGVLVAVVAGALYVPPFDTSIMGSDASFYLSGGVYLARHGTLAITDPLLPALPAAERALLFPPNIAGGWARIPGGLLLPTLGVDAVHPSFGHMLPAWIAIFHELGGLAACGWVAPVFAALALWAIGLVAGEVGGRWTALLAVALAATNLGTWFYGRFLMPEVVAQAYVWGGLLALVVWRREGSPAAAVVAAMALGVAGLTRVELLFLLPLAVMLLVLREAPPPAARALVMLYGVLIAHGAAHLALVPSHYGDVVGGELRGLWPPGTRWVAAALLLVAAVGAVAGRLRGVAFGVLGVAAVAYILRSKWTLPTTLGWLAETTSWGVLALAAAGTALLARRPSAAPLVAVFVVAGLPLLYDPRVMPVQLWAVRRFVPVVIPFLCVGAAVATVALGRRWGRVPGVGLALVLLVLNAQPMWVLRGLALFPPQRASLRVLADGIPADAVAVFAPELTQHVVHLPLWLVWERVSLVLPGPDGGRVLARVAPALLRRGPVVYVGNAFGPPPAAAGLTFTPREQVELRTLVPALHPTRAPAGADAYRIPLRLYDVVASAAG